MLLKRKVKKLIEDEDPRKPLTDDHLAAELQRQGIRVTRRTVAEVQKICRFPVPTNVVYADLSNK